MSNLSIDLYSDYAALCKRRLAEAGYPCPSTDNDEIVLSYLNVRHRRVPVRPRKVHRRGYIVPPALAQGHAEFLAAVTQGDDLRPYQSTRLTDANFNDGMLNDFGIQHFHLGIGPYPRLPGFKDRTGDVLLAMVRPDDFYAIGIFGHGVWSDWDLLDFVYADWPKLLEPVEVKGVLGMARSVSKADHAELRKNGINTFTRRPDGKYHMGPGMGLTSAKGSAAVSLQLNDILHQCDHITDEIAKAFALAAGAGQTVYPAWMRLAANGGRPVVYSADGVQVFQVDSRLAPMPLTG
ncbi:hypothetical protein [Telmatospirillum sp.]|jgi:hypothetical protein|uniref:hypothetical protein n=1 Tax=Telmatospirillum sp. TaxID=2079197 RepID=UPI00283EDC71|nr:hypothetical protein [Telmatospirillum sp.]MDR3435419.1 hypothetical protein [Telmatospirillum sp.]